MIRLIKRYRKVLLIVAFCTSLIYYYALPKVLFDDPYATVVNDFRGELMSARIASDGQWRFPEIEEIPEKYEKALLLFEDQHFYKHPGVNPVALGRALWQNVSEGKVVSGGSTITMQVIRLARKGKGRSIGEKLIEMTLATRLELRYKKSSILKLYASHAPFGGNTVGLSAASWRYFQRPPEHLSWAESALLAILPNQPSLLFPGRRNERLKAKRDRLLDRLYGEGHMDLTSLDLAKAEPLPDGPSNLPQKADHFLNYISSNGKAGKVTKSTIDGHLQTRVTNVLNAHHQLLKTDGIHNAAVLVLDVKENKVISYNGNVSIAGSEHASYVDVIQAPRSTGSLLKPILYASLLDEGMILPKTLIPDVPTFYSDFAPKNFTRKYDGAVHADMAISRSLNVPAVNMLKQYGYPRFHQKLRGLGMSTLTQPADHYGLAMILGGSDGTLWDMANIYAGMSRTLSDFQANRSSYNTASFDFADYSVKQGEVGKSKDDSMLSASSIWFAFQAMLEVYRPDEDSSWKMYSSSRKVAWKTGTSFGYRDGWAIGVTPEYVVGVWVGNADGEGRPGLTGIKAAAPIMFDVFDLLPETSWFLPPRSELTTAAVDRQSGHLASPYSSEVDTVFIPKVGLRTAASPYHQRVHLTKTGDFRVNAACYPLNDMIAKNWFVLPPKQAFYFRKKNPTYQELPPLLANCADEELSLVVMDMIYPEQDATLYIPIQQDGTKGQLIFEATHRKQDSELHWHLDDTYLGSTNTQHVMGLQPVPGDHVVRVIDSDGNELVRSFKVLSREGDE
ncbi:penicillin-binding protein 1C [Roseivirga sp. 4D4]|uniref:penicillin-binding protein 1C n=1 Tax=Roseivirga sp. 4D4 TaxID=1889784 RepID=UPI000852988A|nr:penicillin-binding protein 1C [Roseivirga sp. 4D4]OEK01808.1 penicillin-binding protein 1C [Roseivirga sp. 4D4]